LNKKSRKEIIMKKNVCVLVPLLLVFLVSKVNADYYGPALKIPMDESEGTVVCATIPGGSATHTGGTYYALDFLPRAGVINEPILATAGGKVQYVKNSNCPNVCCNPSPGEPGYDPSLAAGCNVRIDHGNGYISLYGPVAKLTFQFSNANCAVGNWELKIFLNAAGNYRQIDTIKYKVIDPPI
jgi:hypothetical protein